MPNLAIIVPIYNPHDNWYNAISDSIAGFDCIFHGIDYSIVLVNDGSTNFDESLVDKLKTKTNRITFLSYPVNMGKGYCIRYGLSRVEANYYVYTDIDFPFGFEVIHRMYEMLDSSTLNLIIGTRDKAYFKLLPFKRRLLSKTFHLVSSVLTRFRVYDTQAGIKGFDNVAKNVFLNTKINRFLFDLEFVRNCLKRRLNYSVVNVQPRPNIVFTDFRLSIIKQEISNLFKIVFRI